MSGAAVVVLVVELLVGALTPTPPAPVPEPVALARHEVRAELTRHELEAREAHAAWHAEQEAARAAEAAASAADVGWPWDALAACESGGRWDYNGSSGYDGGLQFHPGTWSAYAPAGFPAYAWQATRAQQVTVAERVLAAQGWRAWPACSRKLGLRP